MEVCWLSVQQLAPKEKKKERRKTGKKEGREEKKKKSRLIVFVNFSSINSPMMADFKKAM